MKLPLAGETSSVDSIRNYENKLSWFYLALMLTTLGSCLGGLALLGMAFLK